MSFHVSETCRVTSGPLASDFMQGNNGAFLLSSPSPGWQLFVIASDGDGWEHVSVHARCATVTTRIPSWSEMVYVKGIFWDEEDVVMQLHPKRSEYVNQHPHVLHMWRPIGQAIPTPPMDLVGARS